MTTWKTLLYLLLIPTLAASSKVTRAQPTAYDTTFHVIVVDLGQADGWGPFVPTTTHLPVHYVGRFTLQGAALGVVIAPLATTTRKKSEEASILFYRATERPRGISLQSNLIHHPYESVDLGGTKYEILDVSFADRRLILVPSGFIAQAPGAPRPGAIAPDFADTTLSGEPFKLSDLRGKYVLLDFWGTWCSPCIEEMPFLEAASVRYGSGIKSSGPALEVVGIAQDDADQVRSFIQKRPVMWTQIIQPEEDSPILTLYGIKSYPTHYLIDPDGVIVSTNPRILHGEGLLRTLKRLLN